MPLDPFFRDRLRTHRRYLLRQAWMRLRARLRPPGSGAPSTDAPPGAPEVARRPASPPLSPRARHRRAALAWDREELRTVGMAGPAIETVEHIVEVPGRPSVRVRLYLPDERVEPAPACLVLAGGAFRIGGIDYPTADAACRRRAQRSGVVLVAVDYALAPEHRYPTQVDQAEAVWQWMHARAADLGIDPQRFGIAGASAGGCLAAALTLRNRDGAALPVALQILEVPVTDLTGRWIDLRATWALGIPAIVALRELASVARTYLGDRRRAREALASPMRAASHAGLPPAVVLTAEYDPLRRDGAVYAAKLRAAGVDATATRYLGVTHDTPIYVGALPAARRWEDEVVTALRRL